MSLTGLEACILEAEHDEARRSQSSYKEQRFRETSRRPKLHCIHERQYGFSRRWLRYSPATVSPETVGMYSASLERGTFGQQSRNSTMESTETFTSTLALTLTLTSSPTPLH